MYFCLYGRITINPDTEFLYTNDKRVYIIYSQIFLPSTVSKFLIEYGSFIAVKQISTSDADKIIYGNK
jgi:hypothetical protein